MSELSPARQALLQQAMDVHQRMLDGCCIIFRSLATHQSADVADVAHQALTAINNNRELLDAMVDSLNATHH